MERPSSVVRPPSPGDRPPLSRRLTGDEGRVPDSGLTFLNSLPYALFVSVEPAGARPLWKSPWLLLPKNPLLPVTLADLSMLGVKARGTDCVLGAGEGLARAGDANRELCPLGAALLGAGAD